MEGWSYGDHPMTPTGVTNLDILELSVPSIEAGEIHSGAAPAGQVLTADGSGGAAWQTANGGGGSTYGVYTASLWQSGSDAPDAQVFENTIGGVVWTRQSSGLYRGTSPAISTQKTAVLFSPVGFADGLSGHNGYSFMSFDVKIFNGYITIATALYDAMNMEGGKMDSVMNNVFIEIRVYP
jgi:hypothetical protein